MQNKLAEKIPEYTLLIVSVFASILWYFDIISEPAVALVSSLFGLFISIMQIKIIKGSEKSEKNSIVFNKKFDSKDGIIIILFLLLIIFILFDTKNEVTGIKGDNNHGNQIEIRD